MLPNVVTVNVTALGLLLVLPVLPDEHPAAMRAKDAAPATAETTLVRRERFTVTPLSAWKECWEMRALSLVARALSRLYVCKLPRAQVGDNGLAEQMPKCNLI